MCVDVSKRDAFLKYSIVFVINIGEMKSYLLYIMELLAIDLLYILYSCRAILQLHFYVIYINISRW